MLKPCPARQRGVALTEFQIVALLGVLPLLLGALQVFLLLVAAHTVQFATFSAARSGAMNGADPAVMKRAFARGLLPLHAAADAEIAGADLPAIVAAAYARASAESLLFADIEILAPDSAAFGDFSVPAPEGRAIPNDGLLGRGVEVGSRSGLSLQEANLLRIRARWCHPLLVPFIDGILIAVLRHIDDDPFSNRCYVANRVPLAGDATVNMQSDARFHGP
ncbi:MAG: hypothetical protein RLZZ393_1434 [Pseudomonadota bacterium]|jgi:hypothetical protein